ncbi:hypothetical protein PTTW11_03591 [Pyrenophora teres f. teres]|uniref:Uncharacterized protein n=1 Tax=Pyrenophora teres f. teres TaxID=97479 RepID=A0A6S6VM48_9PLEO|nr:hypothetical protein PTTW11_03591 [Pyrenophora teres f. teres]
MFVRPGGKTKAHKSCCVLPSSRVITGDCSNCAIVRSDVFGPTRSVTCAWLYLCLPLPSIMAHIPSETGRFAHAFHVFNHKHVPHIQASVRWIGRSSKSCEYSSRSTDIGEKRNSRQDAQEQGK